MADDKDPWRASQQMLGVWVEAWMLGVEAMWKPFVMGPWSTSASWPYGSPRPTASTRSPKVEEPAKPEAKPDEPEAAAKGTESEPISETWVL